MPFPFIKIPSPDHGLLHAQSKARVLIFELDRVLTTLRHLWLTTPGKSEKEKWRWRIDQALDERLRLMRIRDFVPSVSRISP